MTGLAGPLIRQKKKGSRKNRFEGVVKNWVGHYAKRKKPGSEDYIFYNSIFMKLPEKATLHRK